MNIPPVVTGKPRTVPTFSARSFHSLIGETGVRIHGLPLLLTEINTSINKRKNANSCG